MINFNAIKRLTIFILVFSLSIPALFTEAHALSTSAKASALIDAESKTLLYGENCDARLPMASTTKIMTALVALENADIDAKIKVPAAACKIEGTSIYLKEGEELSLRELLYAMMLESANDAAAAIAISVGGSIEGFAELMNKKAKELALENTSFENPHGLDGENHYTSARDLALLTAYALKNEDFALLVSTYKKTIPYGENSSRYLLNHNKMLKLYDGAIGVKTGFTKKSGRCLVSAAKRDGLTLVAVTLSCPDDWHDHAAMLDYGFENFEMRTLASENEFEFTLECVGSDESIRITNKDEVTALFNKNDTAPTVIVELPRFVYAPKHENDVVGKLKFKSNGEIIAEADLVCANDAPAKAYKKSILEKIFG